MCRYHWTSLISGSLLFNSIQDIRLQNLGDLQFDLSGSLKVKSNGAVGL